MTDVQSDDITRVLKDTLQTFAAAELWPEAGSLDHAGEVPEALWQKIDELGVTAPFLGEEFLTPHQYLMVAEELGRGDPAVALGALTRGHVALLASYCEPESLPGELRAALSDAGATTSLFLYEGFGRDPGEFMTLATPGDGGWSLTGRKYVVGGPALPDLAVVIARDASNGSLKAFLVEAKNSDGLTVERDGAEVRTSGLGGAAPVSRVRLDAVKAVAVLPIESEALLRSISLIRLAPAAIALGATAKGIEYTAEYANERIAFGKPISQHQGVSFMLVDGKMSLEAERMAFEDATTAIETNENADTVNALVTRTCGDTFAAALQATRDCVQVLGGHGFIKDHPVERLYRAAAGIASLDTDLRHLAMITSRIS